MEINTNTLIGESLDYSVAMALGWTLGENSSKGLNLWFEKTDGFHQLRSDFIPSTNWNQGGPIIHTEKITLGYLADDEDILWESRIWKGNRLECIEYGPTPLAAAMRCFVASKFGKRIDIPEKLFYGI